VRYLSQLDTANVQKLLEAFSAKTPHLKERSPNLYRNLLVVQALIEHDTDGLLI
jgi:hypothetical protein